jgi:tetratricopeptide (TPR) repeat protein
MARSYEAILAPVSLEWRRDVSIVGDLELGASGSATNLTRAQLAEIERLIRDGDALYTRRRYERAVAKYKEARARILSFIRPRFHLDSYLTHRDRLLPLDPAVERQLLEAATHLLDAVRPRAPAAGLPLVPGADIALPAELAPLMQIGYHEARSVDAIVNDASSAGAGLLADGKPQAAVALLESALAAADRVGTVDRDGLAVLQLNLATALVQTGEAVRAEELANAAFAGFKQRRDVAGEAQALHVAGAAAKLGRNNDKAREYFEKAAARIGERHGRRVFEAPVRDAATGLGAPRDVTVAALRAPDRGSLSQGSASFARIEDDSRLERVLGKEETLLPFRVSGLDMTWGTLELADTFSRNTLAKTWSVGVPLGEKVVTFKAADGKLVAAEQLENSLYAARIQAADFADIRVAITDSSSSSVYALHLYGFALPVKIGDCYHRVGRFSNAEANYRQAAGYSYLNRHIEASLVWIRLARNALAWGEMLYKEERLDAATAQFEKLVMSDGSEPGSFLYATASLGVPADQARRLLADLDARPRPVINRAIAYAVMRAHSHLRNIAAGFDYYGLLLSPIHTFEYLQGIARSFCNAAIQAEREFVNFKSREEYESATRRDLENTAAMAQSEAEARFQMYQSARDDVRAAERTVTLATQRRDDAIAERNQYAATSATQIWAQAASQALLGGEDGMYAEISALADRLERGETISGAGPLLAAAQTLLAGRKSREYELERMQNNIDQLTQAIAVAQAQLDASRDRERAAELYWQAALEQVGMAQEALAAFDDEFFTPDAWSEMAEVMRAISGAYLERAIRIAKLMERAYNFENDETLSVIKADYGHGVANEAPGRDTRLLAGDALLVDVESFTFHAITHTTRKNSRVKDIISLAGEFPAQFEQFLETGLLEFETDLYEFDRLHPGYYEQRIEAVELEVVGLLGDRSPNGTLTGGGVSSFRKRDNTTGSRAHVIDTMAVSEFELRNDIFLYTADTGIRGLFQGLGLGGTWQLHLPRRSNDFDLRRIFDIRLALYYKAKYDPGLRATVLALPVRPGEHTRQRTLSLRYDFPASWYAFYQSGVASFQLERHRLPANQTAFESRAVRVRVLTQDGVDAEALTLEITPPGGAAIEATTAAGGIVSSEDAGLEDLAGASPLGDWRIAVTGGAPLEGPDGLDFSRVHNLQLSIDYAYEYLPEAI